MSDNNKKFKSIALTNQDGTVTEYGNTNKGKQLLPGSITLSTNSVSLDYSNTSATVNLTVVGDGNLSVSVLDDTVCEATLNGNILTITGEWVASNSSTTVVVTLSDGPAYKGVTASVSVSNSIIIVTWANGTDEEIVALVQAADAGLIDLYEDAGWRVGDERTVSLSAMEATGVGESHAAQTATLVLLHQGLYELVTATSSGRTTCSFVVGLKNSLKEMGYMNSTNTNTGSWKNSKRRAWCNSVFYNAIPSSIRSIFKQFKTVTAATYNGSTNETTEDYFALAAGAEVFKGDSSYGGGGTAGQATAYSNLTEFNALTRFKYYETTANRVKKLGDNGYADYWWERSPYYASASSFCAVSSDGSVNYNGASGTYGLAPFGCI